MPAVADIAFTFVCPHCARRSFVVGTPAELEPDMIGEARADGMDPTDFISRPDEAECERCGRTVALRSPGEEESE